MPVKPSDQVETETQVRLRESRIIPRSYPVVDLPIYDVDDPTVEGVVFDISERGVKIAGIQTRKDARKTFFIQASDFGAVNPFSFEAECRWVSTDPEDGTPLAGFEITGIADQDLEEMRSLISVLAFTDEC